ncbi:MAG: flagellar hook-length control protein FliK [Spirochaetota bacterium]|nr:flagellar hook-length control protein FliK [Spirochaetota bacterium]
MLPVQMPVQRSENSFDSNDLNVDKSVKSDNLREKGKFTEVFESASNEYKKMEKSDVEQKSKSAVKEKSTVKERSTVKENDADRKNIISDNDSVKELKQKNRKLIGLRKVGPGSLNTKIKETSTDEDLKKTVSNKTEISEDKSDLIKDLLTDNYSEVAVVNPEAGDIPSKSSSSSDSVGSSLESSEAGLTVMLKGPVLNKTEGNSKKADKKSLIKKDSRTSKAKISVLDLRQTEAGNSKTKRAELNVNKESQKFVLGSTEQLSDDNNLEAKPIVIELTHLKDNFSSESKTLTSSSSSALMKQLEESVNGKIIKQSSIVLKDGGSGEIKLILKPEQLGSVRIKLNLTDNKLTGQIIVDSSAVKEVFEQNLQNLERAFKESGFDTAALNVSVGGDHPGSREREQSSDISKQIELIDEIIPAMISESENLIDLVV